MPEDLSRDSLHKDEMTSNPCCPEVNPALLILLLFDFQLPFSSKINNMLISEK
jgi:hypothetical protein